MHILSPNSKQLTPSYLDHNDRPTELQEVISQAFNCVQSDAISSWGCFRGEANYGLCGVDEYALMKKIIQQADLKIRKDFYALDIGAGGFQWSIGLAKFIDEQTDLPEGVRVHIFGIRGEYYSLKGKVIETDRCKIYNLGSFAVEWLVEEFECLGFDLENKVDLAVTRWSFRHLADPVGTFVQAYNLLRPQTGVFLLDGFFFFHQGEDACMQKYSDNRRITRLFLDTKAPFLTRFHDYCYSLNQFILLRPSEDPCHLPMSYFDYDMICPSGWQVRSECVVRFKRELQEGDHEVLHLPRCNDSLFVHGDKKMHDWLKKNELLEFPNLTWRPLRDQDVGLGYPPLHRAILENESLDKVIELLNRGFDIDESDVRGRTPLHLAILKGDEALFHLLIQKGAHLGLSTFEGQTPLHLAAAYDFDGRFLKSLVEAGAKVGMKIENLEADMKETPLDSAVRAKNFKGAQLLISAGAKVSKKNRADLEDSLFLPLAPLLT